MSKSPIYCNHANEVVSGCLCPEDCYCRAYGLCSRKRDEIKPYEWDCTLKDEIKSHKWDCILLDVIDELTEQIKKWGIQNHDPQMWMNILMEEVGEASQAMMEHHFRKENPERYREELVQVAAVAIAAIENYDRSRR